MKFNFVSDAMARTLGDASTRERRRGGAWRFARATAIAAWRGSTPIHKLAAAIALVGMVSELYETAPPYNFALGLITMYMLSPGEGSNTFRKTVRRGTVMRLASLALAATVADFANSTLYVMSAHAWKRNPLDPPQQALLPGDASAAALSAWSTAAVLAVLVLLKVGLVYALYLLPLPEQDEGRIAARDANGKRTALQYSSWRFCCPHCNWRLRLEKPADAIVAAALLGGTKASRAAANAAAANAAAATPRAEAETEGVLRDAAGGATASIADVPPSEVRRCRWERVGMKLRPSSEIVFRLNALGWLHAIGGLSLLFVAVLSDASTADRRPLRDAKDAGLSPVVLLALHGAFDLLLSFLAAIALPFHAICVRPALTIRDALLGIPPRPLPAMSPWRGILFICAKPLGGALSAWTLWALSSAFGDPKLPIAPTAFALYIASIVIGAFVDIWGAVLWGALLVTFVEWEWARARKVAQKKRFRALQRPGADREYDPTAVGGLDDDEDPVKWYQIWRLFAPGADEDDAEYGGDGGDGDGGAEGGEYLDRYYADEGGEEQDDVGWHAEEEAAYSGYGGGGALAPISPYAVQSLSAPGPRFAGFSPPPATAGSGSGGLDPFEFEQRWESHAAIASEAVHEWGLAASASRDELRAMLESRGFAVVASGVVNKTMSLFLYYAVDDHEVGALFMAKIDVAAMDIAIDGATLRYQAAFRCDATDAAQRKAAIDYCAQWLDLDHVLPPLVPPGPAPEVASAWESET
jgi:hypothetical protein